MSVKKCKGAIVTSYGRNLMKEIACKCHGQHLIIKQEFAPDSDAQNKSYVEMLDVLASEKEGRANCVYKPNRLCSKGYPEMGKWVSWW